MLLRKIKGESEFEGSDHDPRTVELDYIHRVCVCLYRCIWIAFGENSEFRSFIPQNSCL